MCKVHANIDYFLFYYEMKYDIKPNLQLIVILSDMLCLNYWKYIYKNREEIMDVMWDIRKEEKWILILRVNALFLEKWNQTSLLSLLHLYYTPFFDKSIFSIIFFIYICLLSLYNFISITFHSCIFLSSYICIIFFCIKVVVDHFN